MLRLNLDCHRLKYCRLSFAYLRLVAARSHFALELARDEIRVQIQKCHVLQLILGGIIKQLPDMSKLADTRYIK